MITNNLLSPLMCVVHIFLTIPWVNFFLFSRVFVLKCNRNEIFYLFAVSFLRYIFIFYYFCTLPVKFSLDTCVWMRISTRKCYRTMTVLRVSLSQNPQTSFCALSRYFHSFNSLRPFYL